MPFLEAVVGGAVANGLSNWGAAVVQGMHSASQRRGQIRRNLIEPFNARRLNPLDQLPDTYVNIQSQIENDLRIVLSSEGMLTISTDLTLNTIAASSIIPHMINCASCDFDPRYSRELIDCIFASVGGRETHASNPLSSVIWNAIHGAVGAAEISHSGEEFKSYVRKVEVAIQALVNQYKSQVANGDIPSQIPPDVSGIDFDKGTIIFKSLAREIYRHLNIIDVHGATGEILATDLTSIFVDMPVYSLGAQGNISVRGLQAQLRWSERESFGYKKVLESIDRSVLLGNPGGGKSTLAKKLCLEIADGAQQGGLVIPLFIQLRTYVAEKSQDKSLTLVRYVLNQAASYMPDIERKVITSSMQYILSVGRCFIVFDGLDEVLSDANKIEVVREIDNISKRYPLSRILVTSRIVGYKQIPIPGFTNFVVGDLNIKCSQALYEVLSDVVFKMDQKRIGETWPVFWKEARSKASDLIATPLLYTLITFMFHRKIDIPNTQADLYNSCSRLLFDRWDTSRKIDPHLPESHRLWDLLMFLSRYMYEDPASGARITKQDLIDRSTEFFIPDYLDNKKSRAQYAAEKFADHLTGRSWVLCEIGEDVFEFTHRTFLEYFYARYIVSEHPSVADLTKFIGAWLASSERVVATQLALQIITKESRSNSDYVTQTLLATFNSNVSEGVARFSAQALHYLAPSAEQTAALTRVIVTNAIARGWVGPLQELFRNAGPVSSAVKVVAADTMSAALTVKQARALSALWDDAALQKRGADGDRLDVSTIVQALNALFQSKQYVSPYVTKLAFDLKGVADDEALARHGLRIWARDSKRERSDTRTSDTALMVLEMVRAIEGRANFDDLQYATLARRIMKTAFEQMGKWDFDHSGPYFASLVGQRIISDHTKWIEDNEIIETLAFSCALHIEMSEAISSKNTLRGTAKIFFESVDLLEELDSSKASIFRVWEKGEVSFFSRDVRAARRRAALSEG